MRNKGNLKQDWTFNLLPVQAQTIFGILECMKEEPAFREIWKSKKRRKRALLSVARFSRQLNAHYARTGVEIWNPDA
jgi:hypothetical protein